MRVRAVADRQVKRTLLPAFPRHHATPVDTQRAPIQRPAARAPRARLEDELPRRAKRHAGLEGLPRAELAARVEQDGLGAAAEVARVRRVVAAGPVPEEVEAVLRRVRKRTGDASALSKLNSWRLPKLIKIK